MSNVVNVSVNSNRYEIVNGFKPTSTELELTLDSKNTITTLFNEILGRPPLLAETDYWLSNIQSGAFTNVSLREGILTAYSDVLTPDGSYTEAYKDMLRAYNNADIPLSSFNTSLDILKDNIVIDFKEVSYIYDKSSVFSNIWITNRMTGVPDGFTISYDKPMLNSDSIDSITSYRVIATVTHTASGDKVLYEFPEVVYPTGVTSLTLLGRTIIPMDSIEPIDIINDTRRLHMMSMYDSYVESNGSVADSIVFSAFADILGVNFITSSGLNYWSSETQKHLDEGKTDSEASELIYNSILTGVLKDDIEINIVKEHARVFYREHYGTLLDKYARVTIPMDDIPTSQCKTSILANTKEAFVQTNGTSADTEVFNAYSEVLDRSYIESSALNYYSQLYLEKSLTPEQLKYEVAKTGAAFNIGCTTAIANAKAWLSDNNFESIYPIDKYGRVVLSWTELLEGRDDGDGCITSTDGNVYVKSNGSDEDELIVQGYSEVLKRNYVDSEGFEYWHNEIVKMGWDSDTFKKALAIAGQYSECPAAAASAIQYLEDNDIDGAIDQDHDVIPMSDVPDSQCKTLALATGRVFAKSDDSDEDNMIVLGYKNVLDRYYIEASSFVYWHKQIVDNSWSQDDLESTLADAAFDLATSSCYLARRKAAEWLIANGKDVPNDYDIHGRIKISLLSVTDQERVNYAKYVNTDYVLPNIDSDEDYEVVTLYTRIFTTGYVLSEDMEKWSADDATGDELGKKIAYSEITRQGELSANSSSVYSVSRVNSAHDYLDSLGEQGNILGGRNVIDNSIVLAEGNTCDKQLIGTTVMVESDGSDNDKVIFNAYYNVLGRKFIDNAGLNYWRDTYVDTLTGTYENKLIAFSAFLCKSVINGASVCQESMDKAQEYYNDILQLGSGTINEFGREFLSDSIPLNEADQQVVDLGYRLVLPLEDNKLDNDIATIYNDVLGREYVDSGSLHYWNTSAVSSNWSYDTLAYTIACAGAKGVSAVSISVTNAVNWLKNKKCIFCGLTVNSRFDRLDGYAINFTPETAPTDPGTYTVTYTVTHNDSLVVSDSNIFTETVEDREFVTDDEITLYGTELEKDLLESGTKFIYVNTNEERELLDCYIDVLGRKYIDSGGANYWLNDSVYKESTNKKVTIALGGVASGSDYAKTWLSTNPDVWFNVDIKSRDWQASGYTVVYNPVEIKETITPTTYDVTATVSIYGNTKVFTFSENSKIVDIFENYTDIAKRGVLPTDGYSVVYSEPIRPATEVRQEYDVTVTVTHLGTGKIKQATFTEIVESNIVRETKYGGFRLLDPSTLPSTECINSTYSDEYIDLDTSDAKSVKIFSCYKTVMNRDYVDAQGHWYWYTHSWIVLEQEDFNIHIATVAATHDMSVLCPIAANTAYDYLADNGYYQDTDNRWYKLVWNPAILDSPSYWDYIDGDPIYKDVVTDYSLSVVFPTNKYLLGSGTAPAKGTTERRTLVEKGYKTYLLREGESAGVDWWTNDATITTIESFAQTLIDAAHDSKYSNEKKLIASYLRGYYNKETVASAISDNVNPPVSWYTSTSREIVGYEQVKTLIPAVTHAGYEKVYL